MPPPRPLPQPLRAPIPPLRRRPVSPMVPLLGASAILVILAVVGWSFWPQMRTSLAKLAPAMEQSQAGAAKPAQPVQPVLAPRPQPNTANKPLPPIATSRIIYEGTGVSPPPAPSGPIAALTADAQVATLVRALENGDTEERRQAAATLHSLGPDVKSAEPTLRKALRDPDSEVRLWSALALTNQKTYDPAAVPVLVEALKNTSPMLRQVACLSLGVFPLEDAQKQTVTIALVETARTDADEDSRKAAISALAVVSPDKVSEGQLK